MGSLASLPSDAPTFPVALPELSDRDAVNQVLHGQREMFEIIVRRYNGQLYRVGMAYLRHHAQTEDAMQNTYLKAFTSLHRYQGTAMFATWLTRIMINECLMMLRSQKRLLARYAQHEGDLVDAENSATTASDVLDGQEIKALLEQSLAALPATHRAVYLLREVQHLSTAETAECLGISCENVKVSLHRARGGLKAQLLKSAEGVELFSYPARYCNPLTAQVMRAILALPPPVAHHDGGGTATA